METLATVTFAIAIVHTFLTSQFQNLASKYPEGSVGENLFHLLGEVEVVFGLWAAVFIGASAAFIGQEQTVQYTERLSFKEPLFVFAIMTVAATKPIIFCAQKFMFAIAHLIPIPREIAVLGVCLFVGPILGSLITEPAAMTVTALILRDRYFSRGVSEKFKYAVLGSLFVNISIGGILTSFAAPPVLMVAPIWKWTTSFMFYNFGWKAVIITLINSSLTVLFLNRELRSMVIERRPKEKTPLPVWLITLHFLFLGLVVINSHHAVIFMGLFLLFLGLSTITQEFQDELLLRQSLLVAFFLSGLVVLGGLQEWWLGPLITQFSDHVVFLGAAALTAVTDNAALTYLGSQIPEATLNFKYALVAGAVAGGGLTVIANAPNPAGFSILQDSFDGNSIHPLKLLIAALPPTFVAVSVLWFFWI